jgi:hypothetical protein
MDSEPLRHQLARTLDWEDAHVSFDRAVEGIPKDKRGVVPPGAAWSLWQLLEHIRRTQFDILDFCRNPHYEEPASMEAYWPDSSEPPSDRTWRDAVTAVRHDREALKALARDPAVDLFARIPHGAGQTYLRELVLVADHTAYHVGQIVAVRRLLDIWPRQ